VLQIRIFNIVYQRKYRGKTTNYNYIIIKKLRGEVKLLCKRVKCTLPWITSDWNSACFQKNFVLIPNFFFPWLSPCIAKLEDNCFIFINERKIERRTRVGKSADYRWWVKKWHKKINAVLQFSKWHFLGPLSFFKFNFGTNNYFYYCSVLIDWFLYQKVPFNKKSLIMVFFNINITWDCRSKLKIFLNLNWFWIFKLIF
jgi:hypothetical protein